MKKEISVTINLIERFLSGEVDPYEWDDFISVPVKNQKLEELRLICVNLPKNYPPSDTRHYCNSEGLAFIENKIQLYK